MAALRFQTRVHFQRISQSVTLSLLSDALTFLLYDYTRPLNWSAHTEGGGGYPRAMKLTSTYLCVCVSGGGGGEREREREADV